MAKGTEIKILIPKDYRFEFQPEEILAFHNPSYLNDANKVFE